MLSEFSFPFLSIVFLVPFSSCPWAFAVMPHVRVRTIECAGTYRRTLLVCASIAKDKRMETLLQLTTKLAKSELVDWLSGWLPPAETNLQRN